MQRLFAALFIGFIVQGCGTMSNGRGWGQDATLMPGWERVGFAALNAVRAPETWGPAAGALAMQIGHADRNVSEWASTRTPVYGSQPNAANISDALLSGSGAVWALSAAATPSGGDGAMDWTLNKAKGFAVQGTAGILMRETVGYLKQATDRTRPNGENKVSFPSSHAAEASLYMTMTSRNLEASGLTGGGLTAARLALGTVTAATAWARVEANQHFPSDVLAGIAIGHFFGAFFTDAFLGLDNPRNAMVLFEPLEKGAIASVRFRF
jgi:membrane-associated phospholipid phosphatase